MAGSACPRAAPPLPPSPPSPLPPPLPPAGAAQRRLLRCRTGRMGNKQLRYDDGGWVLMRAVLDKPLAAVLARNINFL